ncbi:autophagy protein 5 [Trichonephila clavipes]|uniref:Autophagy protein 5 n=1 Tax=Trichonephila clavipes TaxID=2585209 RepID=A0A8X6S0N8_TRICX|nr:autophagy protein 5 [Trichonephila clavipes]
MSAFFPMHSQSYVKARHIVIGILFSSRQIQQRCSYSHRERLVAFASRVRVLVPQKTVRASDFRPEGLGPEFESREDMDVYNCPTLNSHRAEWMELNALWRVTPAHPWYFGKKPRWCHQLDIPKDRQTALLSFFSGHIKSLAQ